MLHLDLAFQSGNLLLIKPDAASSILKKQNDLLAKVDKTQAGLDLLASLIGETPKPQKIGAKMTIPISGAIGKDLMPIEKMMGMTDVNDLQGWIRDAEADPEIKQVIFDINSPGGTVSGVPETARMIREMKKDTIAFTDSIAASAAYWLGSQARSFKATASAQVGSIGVYRVHLDTSKMLAQAGVSVKIMKSGKFKATAHPGTEIDPESEKMIQEDLEEVHSDFKSDVKSRRSMIQDADMEGQVFSGKKAAQKGFITGIVNGFGDLI